MTLSEMETYGHRNPQADDEAIVALAGQCLFGDTPVAVEVGVWMGSTTALLADLGFRTFAVDHWQGSEGDSLYDTAVRVGQKEMFGTFCKNMGARLCRTVFPLVGASTFIANAWPDDLEISFLLIDGDHRYEAAMQDIQIWSPRVASGGIVAIHDYEVFEGVTRAVEETGPFERAGHCLAWRRA